MIGGNTRDKSSMRLQKQAQVKKESHELEEDDGAYVSKQERIHAWHLIINHCIYVFWIVTGGDLNTSRQIGDEERIIELILEQQEEKIIIFKPCHQEERRRASGKKESPDGIPS